MKSFPLLNQAYSIERKLNLHTDSKRMSRIKNVNDMMQWLLKKEWNYFDKGWVS